MSRAIAADPSRVFELTNKGNTVAVLSDGSRVLGLGDIGLSIASAANHFGMRVLGLRSNPRPAEGVEQVFGPENLDF